MKTNPLTWILIYFVLAVMVTVVGLHELMVVLKKGTAGIARVVAVYVQL